MSFPHLKKKDYFKAFDPTEQGLQKKKKKRQCFYIKGQIVNILGFENHPVKLATHLSATGAQKQPQTIGK